MKKNLLLSICLFLIGSAIVVAAPPATFTAGNLVVLRYGDGAAAPSTGAQVALFLDEYTKAGVFVQSISLPTTTVAVDTDNDSNIDYYQRAITGTYDNGYEGILHRSIDGAYITFIGYEATVGGASTGLPRVIGRIGAAADINTTTAFHADILKDPRSAATIDGTKFWIAGGSGGVNIGGGTGGVRMLPLGANMGSATTMSEHGERLGGATTSYNTYIFKKNTFVQLYYANGNTVRTLGTGLPESGSQTATELPGFTSGNRPDALQYVMFDTDNNNEPDVMYMTNNGNKNSLGQISKYVLTGGTWVNKGGVQTIATKTENMKFLTAELTGSVVTIYCVSHGNSDTGTPSALYKITNTITEDLSNTDFNSTPLATALANTMFRGVAFAPVATTNPVKLTSFIGKALPEGVRLSWVTSSERNNARFEVLRSVDNVNFSVIGTVNGNNNSDRVINYSFVDTHPLAGTNYYQLNQIDYDAKSEKSAIIPVNYNSNSTILSGHFSSNNQLDISISADKMKNAELYLIDISGKVIVSEKIVLKTGLNSKTLNVKGILQGVYVLNLVSEKERVSIKLLK